MPTNINMSTMTPEDLETYYTSKGSFHNVSGEEFRLKLNAVIKGHREYDFANSTDRFVFKIIDRNWDLSPLSSAQLSNYNYSSDNPYIHKLYADYNNDPAKADLFRNPNADRVSFDKEHIWAQSLGNFGRKYGAGSDFHALWPSDIRGNQVGHNNYSFAPPTQGVVEITNDKGTLVGRNGTNPLYPGNKVFEPLDEYKGDIARAMLYMATRYMHYESTMSPQLELVNRSPNTNTASRTQSGKAGVLEVLLDWHELDPVSDYEIRRNNLLYYNYQLNRNPYIDHPEWARIAYDPEYVGEGASLGEVPEENSSSSSESVTPSEPSEPGESSTSDTVSEPSAPTEPPADNKKGCRGSVSATVTISALLVVTLFTLFIKRRKLT